MGHFEPFHGKLAGQEFMDRFQPMIDAIDTAASKHACSDAAARYAKFLAALKEIPPNASAQSVFYYNASIAKQHELSECIVATTKDADLLAWVYYASISVGRSNDVVDPIGANHGPVSSDALVAALKEVGRAKEALQVQAFEAVIRPKQRELLKTVRERAKEMGGELSSELARLSMSMQINTIISAVLAKQEFDFYRDLYLYRTARFDDEIDPVLDEMAEKRGSETYDFLAVLDVASRVTSSVNSVAAYRQSIHGMSGTGAAGAAQGMNQLLQTSMPDLLGGTTQTTGAGVPIGESMLKALSEYLKSTN